MSPCHKAVRTKVATKLGKTRVLCELSNLLPRSLPAFFLTIKIMFSLASAEQVGGLGVGFGGLVFVSWFF